MLVVYSINYTLDVLYNFVIFIIQQYIFFYFGELKKKFFLLIIIYFNCNINLLIYKHKIINKNLNCATLTHKFNIIFKSNLFELSILIFYQAMVHI